MSQGLKVFFACAFGAFVGAFVGLHFGYLVLGITVGGIAGYLSYELDKVIAAFPAAWRATTTWRPEKQWWKVYFRYVANRACWLSGIVFMCSILLNGLMVCIAQVDHTPILPLIAAVAGSSLVVWVFLISAIATRPPKTISEMELAMKRRPASETYKMFFWEMPRDIVLLFLKLPRWIASGERFVGKFFSKFFRLIHSEIRLLCLVDASIGALIGYFYGSSLIGTLAGGILGLVNFELLSIRILKLVPVSASIFRK